MRLGARLIKLERSAADRPDLRCRTCGHLLHRKRGQVDPEIQYRASFDEPEGPDVCPDCGRRLVIRISFDKGG